MALPDEPHTRLETYLARLAGQDVSIPDTPISRIECYLAYLCENGGGVPASNAGGHNSTFGGKSLGTTFTAEQSAAIQAGTFDGLFVGDYWTINNTVYRIAGFDIFLHTGNVELNRHHAVIVPDTAMYTAPMNADNVTTGGYAGSLLKTSGLDAALTTIKADFGATHIISRRSMLCNLVTNGVPAGWAWTDTEIDLMAEGQVYGRGAWGTQNQNGYNVGEKYSRFPLFSLAPEFISIRQWYWLQDIRNATSFCGVNDAGFAFNYNASYSFGIRPFFCLS